VKTKPATLPPPPLPELPPLPDGVTAATFGPWQQEYEDDAQEDTYRLGWYVYLVVGPIPWQGRDDSHLWPDLEAWARSVPGWGVSDLGSGGVGGDGYPTQFLLAQLWHGRPSKPIAADA
jgi:hypothetical protein